MHATPRLLLLAGFLLLLLLLLLASVAHARGPYPVSRDWTYWLEAKRSRPWPACTVRFLSFNTPQCDLVNLWDGAGGNQEFKLLPSSSAAAATKTNSRTFALSTPNCKDHVVAYKKKKPPQPQQQQQRLELTLLHPSRLGTDYSDAFEFVPSATMLGEYDQIVAVDTEARFVLSYNDDCGVAPGSVFLQLVSNSNSNNNNNKTSTWRAVPSAAPVLKEVHSATQGPCADPFLWWDNGTFLISCTGGDIGLYAKADPHRTMTLNYSDGVFERVGGGGALGGTPTKWCAEDQRWAPEVFPHVIGAANNNSNITTATTMVLCDRVSPGDGPHRIGFVVSPDGQTRPPGAFHRYSKTFLKLAPEDGDGDAAGEIDPNMFQCPLTKRHYLVWKSDDNRLMRIDYTRIFAAEVALDARTGAITSLLSPPRVVLDSRGLWWAVSFAPFPASLIEGPELVYRAPFWYLFFASGRYDDGTYSEGVARSRTGPLGPFEKLPVPLLSTAMVGSFRGQKLEGPGHAGFFASPATQKWTAAFHAHTGTEPRRRVFLTELAWDNNATGWPRAVLDGFF